jgi:hypothetical protein
MVYVVGGMQRKRHRSLQRRHDRPEGHLRRRRLHPFAKPSKTKLIRNGVTYEINLKDISADPSRDIKLQPEDQIIVPE